MPRCRSISIKSLVACFLILLLFTAPAVCIAPPNNKNFSVSVVLPASGCEMIAKVFRLFISLSYFIRGAKVRIGIFFMTSFCNSYNLPLCHSLIRSVILFSFFDCLHRIHHRNFIFQTFYTPIAIFTLNNIIETIVTTKVEFIEMLNN
jgi:hypothetical protein